MPDRCNNCNVQSAYNWLHHSRLMLIVCVWYMYLCGGGGISCTIKLSKLYSRLQLKVKKSKSSTTAVHIQPQPSTFSTFVNIFVHIHTYGKHQQMLQLYRLFSKILVYSKLGKLGCASSINN